MAVVDHVQRGHQYALDVVEGRIDVCRFIKAACQRHLDDLARQQTPRFPYRFDPDRGGKICRFLTKLRHVKGSLAGRHIELLPFQEWLLTTIFGWLCHGGARDGKRRFRRVYLELPRGNAKSTLSSGVALAMLAADGEGGAEVYALGTTRQQSGIVFRDGQQMIRKSPDLMRALGIEVGAHNIRVPTTASKFEALSAEAGTLDGLATHMACCDELHAWSGRALYEVIETSLAKREQSLLWAITTAGTDRASICYEIRTYVTKILSRTIADESTFGAIYTIDDEDLPHWHEPRIWQKANPAWGVAVMPEVIEQLAAKALQMPSARGGFLTKHMCVWDSSEVAWMDMLAWNRCGDPTLDLADFAGESAVIGLDLATKLDLCAKAYIFQRQIGGQTHYYLFHAAYLPEAALSDGRNTQYQGWEIEGRITATPGDVIDFERLELDLLEDMRTYQIDEIAYDPWQATMLATRLQSQGATIVEYRNTVGNFSAPLKEMQALVLQGRLHHNACPLLGWQASNVRVAEDRKGNIYQRKERAEAKIDSIVAAASALGRIMVREHDEYSYYEHHSPVFL